MIYTYLKESEKMKNGITRLFVPPIQEQTTNSKAIYNSQHHANELHDPRVETLVEELIGRVADKWTMIVLELLTEHSEMRFTHLSREIGTISQKMLTQTLRQMERDGLLTRKVYPVVPPKVEYKITELGLTLSAAFCGVWVWAAENLDKINHARRIFDKAKKNNQ